MKHLFLFTIILLTIIPLNAQDKGNPGIVFDTTEFDFGIIAKGANAECIFPFVNISQAPVIITDVEASCGCTSPSWTKEPITPGNTGQIKVKYNTNIAGIFTKTIMVYTNVNKTATILTIKGEVKKKKSKLK